MAHATRRRRRSGSKSPQIVHYGKSGKNLPPLPNSRTKQANRVYNTPVHVARHSYLSSETTQKVTYRGFLNMTILMLVINNTKDVIKNLRTRGVEAELFFTSSFNMDNFDMYRWPTLLTFFALSINIVAALYIEKLNSVLKHDSVLLKLIPWFHTINCSLTLFLPICSIIYFESNPLAGVALMLACLTLTMKLVSFSLMNRKLRRSFAAVEEDPTARPAIDAKTYPNNLTLSNICYFVCVPTLIYQTSYPRSDRIRKRWLVRRVFELIFLSSLILTIAQQYIVPNVTQTSKTIHQSELTHFIERIMALAVPNLYLWLLGFYTFFHLYLNILAEVTRFSDRVFYKDWWNSDNLETFWRKWNIPVHNFLKIHIYTPLAIERSYNKYLILFACFFTSAVAHELVISVPLRSFNIYAFAGMMAQIPLISLTKWKFLEKIGGPNSGNLIFWISIIVGQPFGIVFYHYSQQIYGETCGN